MTALLLLLLPAAVIATVGVRVPRPGYQPKTGGAPPVHVANMQSSVQPPGGQR